MWGWLVGGHGTQASFQRLIPPSEQLLNWVSKFSLSVKYVYSPTSIHLLYDLGVTSSKGNLCIVVKYYMKYY